MTSKYMERVTLIDLTHSMSMANHVTIFVKTPRICSGYSLDKELFVLIYKNL